jgi:anti-sigma factor RsiW
MSCERYRDKLADALASGASALGGELAAHLRACEECKRFYEAQVRLFGAIDSGVRAMVNETVPASLLPRVRARAEQARVGSPWFLRLMPVAGVLLVALLIVVPLVRYGLHSGTARVAGIPERKEISPPPRPTLANVPEKLGASPVKKLQVARRVARSTAAQPEAQAAGVEVLVDPEESRGLRRLAEAVRESPQWAMAMLHPAELPSSYADVIRPVQFSDLEIKPLSEEER